MSFILPSVTLSETLSDVLDVRLGRAFDFWLEALEIFLAVGFFAIRGLSILRNSRCAVGRSVQRIQGKVKGKFVRIRVSLTKPAGASSDTELLHHRFEMRIDAG